MLDKEEGTTVAALLAMPQTPLAAPWESVDEDVFTWLLNGMDTPAADQASSSMPPVQRPFTPLDLAGGNGGLGTPSAAQTNFTWADALNQSLGDALTDHASAAAAAAAAEEYSLLHFLEPLSPAPDRTPASNPIVYTKSAAAARKPPAAHKAKPAAANKLPQLSPRGEANREKAREAVRRCRQRKREQEETLRRQIAELESENAKMKERIAQGSETALQETTVQLRQVTGHIEMLLNSQDPAREEKLARALNVYLERRRTHSGYRDIALSLVHARVARRTQPAPAMKLYLWHGTCPDSYFERKDGLWSDINRALELSPQQKEKLLSRRPLMATMRLQVTDLSKRLKELGVLVGLAAQDLELQFFEFARTMLSPEQMAKLVLWARDQAPVSPRVEPVPPIVAGPLPKTVRASPAELARERIIMLTKGLWDAPKERLLDIAISCCSKDMSLVDPNNGGEFHGLNAALGYVRRIRLAFADSISVDLRDLHLDGERARATWVLSGTYTGKLGVKARRVTFAIVVSYRLENGLIVEMLVSWDAMTLMKQIGLTRGAGKGAAEPAAKRARVALPTDLPLDVVQAQRIQELALVFSQADDRTAAEAVARRILCADCVFQDSYVGGEFRGVSECLDYAAKVRKPFPMFAVVESKTSANEGSALGSPTRVDWTIRTLYRGPAAPKPIDCSFSAVVFVTFDDALIDAVHFSWNVPELLAQLRDKDSA